MNRTSRVLSSMRLKRGLSSKKVEQHLDLPAFSGGRGNYGVSASWLDRRKPEITTNNLCALASVCGLTTAQFLECFTEVSPWKE